MEIDNSFETTMKSLVGNNCSSLIAGKGAGSVVNLGFGKLVNRQQPLKNPTLTDKERNFKSSIELLIYSAWRVIENDGLSYGWRDAAAEDSDVYLKLKRLIDESVKNIQLDNSSKDLQITFESGSVFYVFCDITNDYESEDNYVYYTNEGIYSVGVNGDITKGC